MKKENYYLRIICLAEKALNNGEAPFAALVVKNNQLLAEAYNQTNSSNNPILHAEIVALNDAIENHGEEKVIDSELYTTCEPCMMCLFSAYYSRIKNIYYISDIEDVINFGSGDPLIKSKEIIKKYNLKIEIFQNISMKNFMNNLYIKYQQLYQSLDNFSKGE